MWMAAFVFGAILLIKKKKNLKSKYWSRERGRRNQRVGGWKPKGGRKGEGERVNGELAGTQGGGYQ